MRLQESRASLPSPESPQTDGGVLLSLGGTPRGFVPGHKHDSFQSSAASHTVTASQSAKAVDLETLSEGHLAAGVKRPKNMRSL